MVGIFGRALNDVINRQPETICGANRTWIERRAAQTAPFKGKKSRMARLSSGNCASHEVMHPTPKTPEPERSIQFCFKSRYMRIQEAVIV